MNKEIIFGGIGVGLVIGIVAVGRKKEEEVKKEKGIESYFDWSDNPSGAIEPGNVSPEIPVLGDGVSRYVYENYIYGPYRSIKRTVNSYIYTNNFLYNTEKRYLEYEKKQQELAKIKYVKNEETRKANNQRKAEIEIEDKKKTVLALEEREKANITRFYQAGGEYDMKMIKEEKGPELTKYGFDAFGNYTGPIIANVKDTVSSKLSELGSSIIENQRQYEISEINTIMEGVQESTNKANAQLEEEYKINDAYEKNRREKKIAKALEEGTKRNQN